MIGPSRFIGQWRLVVGVLCVVALLPDCAAAGTPNDLSLRLRLEWGGGTAKRWSGSAEASLSRFADCVPLGVEADEPGSMGVTENVGSENKWFLEPRSPRSYDGADLTLDSFEGWSLTVVLTDVASQKPSKHVIPLDSLIDGAYHAPLDDAGNRLAVRRVPGDRLRVQIDRPSLIFEPGETLTLQYQPHRLGYRDGTPLNLTTSIRPARQTKVLSSDVVELTAASVDNQWPRLTKDVRLPDAEGVYDVVLELSRRDLSSRLRWQAGVERRTVQVVVLAKTPPPRSEVDPHTQPVLLEIDPTHPGWWDRMRTATVPAALRRGPLGNVRPTTRTLIDGSYVELPPTKEPEDPAWQAYPLTAARPGEPHVVEIDYPANVAQSLGVSLVEPNALGSVAPLGLDMGLYVDESDVEPTAARRTQRFVVWPKSETPLLVVVNRRRDGPAVFGKIRLLGPRAASNYRPWATSTSAHLPPLKIESEPADGRLLAAYLDRPLFPENFGAAAAIDSGDGSNPRTLDDWVTFYDGARRLIEYLKFSGYNGLLLTVAADGGAIYPSEVLQSTPRYDDGLFFSTGQDPLRKDVVELLLRMCDREGVRVVLGVQFTAPLPKLEGARRAGVAGITPRGPDGQAWNDVYPPEGGLGPHYNPLHPQVQREMKAVVAELQQRYGRRASFAGVAVHLTAEGYTQLPGLDWGLDAETLTEFHRAIGQPPPNAADAATAAVQTLNHHREAWLGWRQTRLTQFYRELGELVGGPNRKLYLTTAHAWQRPDLLRRLQPTLPPKLQFEPLLREAGLDPAALAALPNVEYVRGYRESPLDAPAQHAVNLELNRDATLDCRDPASRPTNRSAMIFHEPHAQRLESLERQSPFQPAQVRLVTQAAATGAAARRPLVHALTVNDVATIFDGGWLLPLGTDEETRRLAGVIRTLPAASFETLPGTPNHVVVRTCTTDEATHLYIVNDAPWTTRVTLEVQGFRELNPGHRSRGGGPSLGSWESRTMQMNDYQWTAELQPYGVVSGSIVGGNVKISNPQVTTPPEVAERLQTRIKQLWARAANLPQGVNGFSDAQRLELTKAISLAEYRLQHGELGDCERLVEGYWPRYLTAYVPAAANEAALMATRPTRPAVKESPPANDGSKRWWPTLLR